MMPLFAAALLSFAAPGAFAAANLQDVMPGARAQSLGGAYTAIADDPFGLAYNAAASGGVQDLETAFGAQRLLGPPGPLAAVFIGYARPLPEWPGGRKTPAGSAFGAGFYAVRHRNVANKDTFMGSYALKLRMPGLANPIRAGVGTRIVSFRPDVGKNQLGWGFDLGAMAEGPQGLRLGAALSELMLVGTDLPSPTFTLGAAYLWQDWILGAVDWRIREGRSALHPGVEFRTLGGLLRFRTGIDLHWAGIDQFAFGIGVDYSPLLVDFAFSLPPAGLNKSVGSYNVSVGYRFGAAPFYGQFVGKSAEESARLRRELEDLRDRKIIMEQELSQIESNRAVLQSEVLTLQGRLEDVRGRASGLEEKIEEVKETPPPVKPLETAPSPTWPKTHVVVEGDTLRSISGRYYGDPTKWERIYKANPDKIERGLPRLGAELTLPAP